MNPTEYTEAAIQTGGYQSKFYGELVPMRIYANRLRDFAIAANDLDKIKKSFFYGRENAFSWLRPKDDGCEKINSQEAIDIVHGILGIATEAGELVEILMRSSVDHVNLKEELGDVLWYIAVLCKTCNFSFEDIMQTNIDKLRLRFPERFNEFDANNRDLAAERKLLEESMDGAKHLEALKEGVENG